MGPVFCCPGFVLILLFLVVGASTSSFALLLALPTALGLAFAFVAVAFAALTPILGLTLQLDRQAVFVVQGGNSFKRFKFRHFAIFFAFHHQNLIPGSPQTASFVTKTSY